MTSTTRRILLLALLVTGALAGLASAAQAKTTTWHTINVASPSAGEGGLFLSTGPGGRVVLERYASGAPHQMWTPVYREWPGAPTTTSEGPFEFSQLISAGRKFVNRLNGQCVTLDDAGTIPLTLERCRWQGKEATRRELLGWRALTTPPNMQTTLGRSGRCLTVDNASNTRMNTLRLRPCVVPEPWHQRFQFWQVASSTCTPGRAFGICGLPSGWNP